MVIVLRMVPESLLSSHLLLIKKQAFMRASGVLELVTIFDASTHARLGLWPEVLFASATIGAPDKGGVDWAGKLRSLKTNSALANANSNHRERSCQSQMNSSST